MNVKCHLLYHFFVNWMKRYCRVEGKLFGDLKLVRYNSAEGKNTYAKPQQDVIDKVYKEWDDFKESYQLKTQSTIINQYTQNHVNKSKCQNIIYVDFFLSLCIRLCVWRAKIEKDMQKMKEKVESNTKQIQNNTNDISLFKNFFEQDENFKKFMQSQKK